MVEGTMVNQKTAKQNKEYEWERKNQGRVKTQWGGHGQDGAPQAGQKEKDWGKHGETKR
jgi:hypothetical protein